MIPELAEYDATFPGPMSFRAIEGDAAAAAELRQWNARRREIGEGLGFEPRWAQYNPATGGWMMATRASAWGATEHPRPAQIYPGLSKAAAERGAEELRYLGTEVEVWPIWVLTPA